MTDHEPFSNAPVIETWTNCRQIAANRWEAFKGDHRMEIAGTLPECGYVLASSASAGREKIIGKILLQKANDKG